MNIRRAALIILIGGAMALAVACEDDEPSQEEALNALCGDLERVELSLVDFNALGAEATQDDAAEARDELSALIDEVRDSAEDVDDASLDELESAYDGLNEYVDGLAAGNALGAEGQQELAMRVDAISSAASAAVADLGCR